MVTPGGFTMSVEMTNCGRLGWSTDRRGYRYTETDRTQTWPVMPGALGRLARDAAAASGFPDFEPDASAESISARNEADAAYGQERAGFRAPIVSVSLGCQRYSSWRT